LWDVPGHRLAARWPDLGQPLWGPDGTWRLAGSAKGLVRLPVRGTGGARGLPAGLRIGPGRLLPGIEEDARAWVLIWLDSAGRHLGVRPGEDRLPFFRVLDVADDSARELWKSPYRNCNYLASSRDGRLVATGSLAGGDGARIWEGATGRLVWDLVTGDANPAFSGNGKLLLTTTGRLTPRGAEFRSWRFDTYEPVAELALNQSTSSPAPMVVGSDGVVAVGFTINDPRLLEPDTLEQIATLSAPEPRMIPWMHFSPDASMLAVASVGTVDPWDLRRLREELALLGLDWERPPYPPAAPAGPLTVELDPGDS
jgi:hypothetical protein